MEDPLPQEAEIPAATRQQQVAPRTAQEAAAVLERALANRAAATKVEKAGKAEKAEKAEAAEASSSMQAAQPGGKPAAKRAAAKDATPAGKASAKQAAKARKRPMDEYIAMDPEGKPVRLGAGIIYTSESAKCFRVKADATGRQDWRFCVLFDAVREQVTAGVKKGVSVECTETVCWGGAPGLRRTERAAGRRARARRLGPRRSRSSGGAQSESAALCRRAWRGAGDTPEKPAVAGAREHTEGGKCGHRLQGAGALQGQACARRTVGAHVGGHGRLWGALAHARPLVLLRQLPCFFPPAGGPICEGARWAARQRPREAGGQVAVAASLMSGPCRVQSHASLSCRLRFQCATHFVRAFGLNVAATPAQASHPHMATAATA